MTRLEKLRELALDLEQALAEAPVNVKAQIAGQYRATLSEIDELEASKPQQKGTVLDELNARRSARGTGSARPA